MRFPAWGSNGLLAQHAEVLFETKVEFNCLFRGLNVVVM